MLSEILYGCETLDLTEIKTETSEIILRLLPYNITNVVVAVREEKLGQLHLQTLKDTESKCLG